MKIRLSTINDIRSLFRINRESFPESLRCKAPLSYWMPYWNTLICTFSAEVYVVDINNKIAGFAIVVLDREKLQLEMKKRRLPLILYIYSYFIMVFKLIISPKVLIALIRKFTQRFLFFFTKNEIQDRKIEPSENTMWIALLAVSPKYRRKGIASLILKFLEERGIELDINIIALHVKGLNLESILLYEKINYVKTRKTFDGFTYKKRIKKSRDKEICI